MTISCAAQGGWTVSTFNAKYLYLFCNQNSFARLTICRTRGGQAPRVALTPLPTRRNLHKRKNQPMPSISSPLRRWLFRAPRQRSASLRRCCGRQRLETRASVVPAQRLVRGMGERKYGSFVGGVSRPLLLKKTPTSRRNVPQGVP